MIKSIGFTKVFLIFLLGCFIAATAFYAYSIATPSLKKVDRKLRQSKTEIAEMTTNMNLLADELNNFEKQKDDFAKLQKLGFFDDQNRVKTRRMIQAMQKESRLLSAKFTVSPADRKFNKLSDDAGYDLLLTNMSFDLEAIEDSDIYKFVYLLNYGFPGQIKIDSLSIVKKGNVTQPVLRQIGVGEAQPLVTGQLNASWRTMVAKNSATLTDTMEGN